MKTIGLLPTQPFWIDRKINRIDMSQTTQTDIITLGDVATRLPSFIPKVPHILNGLKQAYLRTSNTPTGLGIAFEKAVKRNPKGTALLFEDQSYSYEALNEWANQISHYYLSLERVKGTS